MTPHVQGYWTHSLASGKDLYLYLSRNGNSNDRITTSLQTVVWFQVNFTGSIITIAKDLHPYIQIYTLI